uniref:Nuclear transcription factor Y subunit n=1 Tax=Panagrellus redivivus TaxID=6233 RepID=A0A7E4ZRV7_PANRE
MEASPVALYATPWSPLDGSLLSAEEGGHMQLHEANIDDWQQRRRKALRSARRDAYMPSSSPAPSRAPHSVAGKQDAKCASLLDGTAKKASFSPMASFGDGCVGGYMHLFTEKTP